MTRQLSLALIILTISSCSPPPFNLGLSQSAAVASKMALVGQIGRIQSISSQGNTNFAFFPEKDGSGGITLQSGFVTWISQSTSQQIAFVVAGGGQSAYRVVAGPQNPGATNQNPPFPGFTIQSVKSAYNNVIFSYDTSFASRLKYAFMVGDPVGNTYTLPAWTDLTPTFTIAPFFMGGGVHIRGVSISPAPNPAYDYAYMLAKNLGTGNFQEAQFQISQTGLAAPVALRSAELNLSSVGSAGVPQEALYYYDPGTTIGFADWYDVPSSSWMCWKWYEFPPGVASPAYLSGITHRIDAVLTTGELFSTEGDTGRVYDQNGNLLSQFSLTGFSFVGEVYVGGVAHVLFSQALWYNNGLQFNVYSIPTSSLKSLGQ